MPHKILIIFHVKKVFNLATDPVTKQTPIFMDRQLPDGDWSTIDQVNSCKVSPKVVHPGANIQPSWAREKADVFKINGDDLMLSVQQPISFKIFNRTVQRKLLQTNL